MRHADGDLRDKRTAFGEQPVRGQPRGSGLFLAILAEPNINGVVVFRIGRPAPWSARPSRRVWPSRTSGPTGAWRYPRRQSMGSWQARRRHWTSSRPPRGGQHSSTSRDIIFNATNLLESKNLSFPGSFALHQNYPNPFNPITQIRYDLPIDEFISINIYDVIGRRIKSLINTKQGAGFRSITWNATNDLGQPVSAGMYIYTIQAGEFRQTKKMVLLK